VCTGPVELSETGKSLMCTSGFDCPAQAQGWIQHFVSRGALDIEHLGEKWIRLLSEEGLLKTPADIFNLKKHRARLVKLERLGERSVQNLLDAIEKKTRPELARFINALGIRHVGEATARDLSRAFGSLEKIIEAGLEELNAVENIGEVVARSIFEYFRKPQRRREIKRMLTLGVEPQAGPAGGPLEGWTVVFTGGLASMKRAEAKKKVEGLGARVASSVTRSVNVMVAGPKAGSKLAKAKKLGVAVIREEDLLGYLEKARDLPRGKKLERPTP
jgi:DNA ligase (NAD+)